MARWQGISLSLILSTVMGCSTLKNDIASLQRACLALLLRSGTTGGCSGVEGGSPMATVMQRGEMGEAAKKKEADQPETVDEREDAEWEMGSDGKGLLVRVASPPGACEDADDDNSITTTITISVGMMQVSGQIRGPQQETNYTGRVAGGTPHSS